MVYATWRFKIHYLVDKGSRSLSITLWGKKRGLILLQEGILMKDWGLYAPVFSATQQFILPLNLITELWFRFSIPTPQVSLVSKGLVTETLRRRDMQSKKVLLTWWKTAAVETNLINRRRVVNMRMVMISMLGAASLVFKLCNPYDPTLMHMKSCT